MTIVRTDTVLSSDPRPVSPRLAFAAARSGAATEFRARRMYQDALRGFSSNLLDVADLSPAYSDKLLAFYQLVQTQAPTLTDWDEAMAQLEAAGNGMALR